MPRLPLTGIALTFSPDSPRNDFPGDSAPRGAPLDISAHHTTASPELINRDEVRRLLIRYYPNELKEEGIGGDVLVDMRVDEQGLPDRRLVARSSGICRLDMAALRVVAGMRFSPAQRDGKPVRFWIRLPILYRSSP